MIMKALKRAGIVLAAVVGMHTAALAAEQPLYFNVLNQRSVALTAQYWNPILSYVSQKSGVPLELKLAKTSKEGNALAEKGAFSFLYTNHFFTPDSAALNTVARGSTLVSNVHTNPVGEHDLP